MPIVWRQGEIEAAQVFTRWKRWAGLTEQDVGRLSAYWRDELRIDSKMSDVRMVIDLVFGDGRSVRVSTDAVKSTSGTDGTIHDAEPFLDSEPVLEQGVHVGNGTSEARTLSFTIGGQRVKPREIILGGNALAGFGEVALEVDNGDYDHRKVILRGDMIGSVTFGLDEELVGIEVADPKETLNSMLPPWVLSEDRFQNIHPHAVGERTPLVVNQYTNIPAQRVNDNAGNRWWVFAYGHGWTVDTVRVNGASVAPGIGAYKWELFEIFDNFGVPCSVIRFTNAGTGWDDSDVVHVTARNDEEALNPIQVIEKVLLEHSAFGQSGLHSALFSSAKAKIGQNLPCRALVNAGRGSSGGCLDWVEDGFLDSFPMISMIWEGGRYGPVVIDRRSPPVMDLEIGAAPLADRASSVTETAKSAMFNEFVFRYSYDPMENVYHNVATRDPGNSILCRRSKDMAGLRSHPVIESVYVHNDETAFYIVDWMVDHLALPTYLIETVGYPELFFKLLRGDTVRLTWNEMGWSNVPTLVERVTYRRGQTILLLRAFVRLLDVGGSARSFVRA